MSDLVKRLRNAQDVQPWEPWSLRLEAADEIERQLASIFELQELVNATENDRDHSNAHVRVLREALTDARDSVRRYIITGMADEEEEQFVARMEKALAATEPKP